MKGYISLKWRRKKIQVELFSTFNVVLNQQQFLSPEILTNVQVCWSASVLSCQCWPVMSAATALSFSLSLSLSLSIYLPLTLSLSLPYLKLSQLCQFTLAKIPGGLAQTLGLNRDLGFVVFRKNPAVFQC
jgi:hypothetical protein